MKKEAQFTDGDMFAAMCKSVNEGLNIDEMFVKTIEEHEESDNLAKWNGAYYEYNGLDIKNLKNPVFEK